MTKLHLARDGEEWPLAVVLTAGQRHDTTRLEAVLDAIRVPRPGGRGRPGKRPDRVNGDKGYSYERCRRVLRRRGIPHVIPERDDRRARREQRPGRKTAFDRGAGRRRNVVERCINRLKQWRGVATRFEKRAATYRATVVIAALMIWLVQCFTRQALIGRGQSGTRQYLPSSNNVPAFLVALQNPSIDQI